MGLIRYACLALVLAAGGCGGKKAPFTAAIEVPVTLAQDRQDLLAALRQAARVDPALHVEDATAQWLAMQAREKTTPPAKRATLYVGVWRGADDKAPVADAMDYLHAGRVWVTFRDDRDPASSARFRIAALREIRAHFPQAHDLPVLPDGGLPLDRDLRLTAGGYRILAARAGAYGLAANSPLLTP